MPWIDTTHFNWWHVTENFASTNSDHFHTSIDTSAASSGDERDFLPVMSLPVTFSPSPVSQQEKVIHIQVLDDVYVEHNESLSSVISLSTLDTAVDLNPAEAAIIILNDDSKQDTKCN